MTDSTDANIQEKALTLRFEYRGQQHDIASLTNMNTVGDLRALITSMLNIDDFKRIVMKTLQPTKVIDTSDDKKILSEVFRGTRERLIVEEVAQPYVERESRSEVTQPNVKHRKSDFDDANISQIISHEALDPSLQSSAAAATASNTNPPASSTNSSESPMRNRKLPREQSDYPVCSSTGYLLRHPVPSNNSCLFISVHFCLTNGVVDDQIGRSMRKIIAETVASDQERFDSAFLGKSNADYCRWILDDNNWGGAIELSILCKYYQTEIVAIDVKNTILNRFGEDSHYPQRMLLLYDGLHYDPLKFQPLDENQPIQTLFSAENLEVLTLAEELAKEAKQSHQFTDMNTIKMRCTSCNTILDARSASDHAKSTGHVDFVESDK